MARTFRDIIVWQKAHRLVLEIYKITARFPTVERYGLISQIRRSAVSVTTNIVEGYKRKSDKDFAHFLNMADSSLEETKYHLLLAVDLKYMNKEEYSFLTVLTDEIGRMLCGFQRSLKLMA